MINIHRITIFRHLKFLFRAIFVLLCIIGIFIYEIFWGGNIKSIEIIMIVVFMIGVLPSLILHVNYLKVNGNQKLKIDLHKQELLLLDKEWSTIKFKDINYIEIHQVETVRSIPYSKYYYYKIIKHDDSSIIITCLLIDNLNINNMTVLNKNEIFPLI
jgi:hypothetical protein